MQGPRACFSAADLHLCLSSRVFGVCELAESRFKEETAELEEGWEDAGKEFKSRRVTPAEGKGSASCERTEV